MTTKHRLILNVVLGNKISETFLFGSGEVHVQLFPVSVPACHIAIFTTALTVVRDYLAESQLLRARLRYQRHEAAPLKPKVYVGISEIRIRPSVYHLAESPHHRPTVICHSILLMVHCTDVVYFFPFLAALSLWYVLISSSRLLLVLLMTTRLQFSFQKKKKKEILGSQRQNQLWEVPPKMCCAPAMEGTHLAGERSGQDASHHLHVCWIIN